METKHTWIYDPILKGDGTFGGSYIVSINATSRNEQTWPIAEVYTEANAALIAAAPETAAERDRLAAINAELVAALQNALNVLAGLAVGELQSIDRNSPAIAKARAALAKAK